MDLVTGATGLVGANLVRALVRRGREVRVLVRPPVARPFLDRLCNDLDSPHAVERIAGDVTRPESLAPACEGIDTVYHCAALVSMWPGDGAAMQQANVEGTAHVLAAVRAAGVRRLVHCSTVDALGLPEGDAPADESTPWNWERLGIDSPYARTKREAQDLVLAAATEGLDAVVVNPAFMFGAWDAKPSSGRMIVEVAAGRAIAYPSGGNNFVDVEDVVEAMVASAERGKTGACYVLGNENCTYREIFTRIALVVGVAPPRWRIPAPAARLAGRLGDIAGAITGREPAIHSLVVQLGEIDHYYSPARARRELGLGASDVDSAIGRAAAWLRDAGMWPGR